MRALTAADLVITPHGRIYHLDLLPSELAPSIVIVGDPDRVPLVAEFARMSVEVERFHRGLRTMTGVLKSGLRLSVVTSGMGTPSIEIVLGEIIALLEVDFTTRRLKPLVSPVRIIRVGTSGGLRESTALGTPIITEYTVGLDNTGLFYEAPGDPRLSRLEALVDSAVNGRIAECSRSKGKIRSYAARAAPQVAGALQEAARRLSIPSVSGITVSNSGFFCNQGRDIFRTSTAVPEVDRLLAGMEFEGLGFENMEMEASLLCHLGAAQGYSAGAVCCTVANRAKDTFATDIPASVENATAIALEALELLRQ